MAMESADARRVPAALSSSVTHAASGVADPTDVVSTVSYARFVTPPRRQPQSGYEDVEVLLQAFPWLQEGLAFIDMSEKEFHGLLQKIGKGASTEVVLLSIERKCDNHKHLWDAARDMGLPTQCRFSNLQKLINHYKANITECRDEDGQSELGTVVGQLPSVSTQRCSALFSGSGLLLSRSPDEDAQSELGTVVGEFSSASTQRCSAAFSGSGLLLSPSPFQPQVPQTSLAAAEPVKGWTNLTASTICEDLYSSAPA